MQADKSQFDLRQIEILDILEQVEVATHDNKEGEQICY